jgi:hypothetical protein
MTVRMTAAALPGLQTQGWPTVFTSRFLKLSEEVKLLHLFSHPGELYIAFPTERWRWHRILCISIKQLCAYGTHLFFIKKCCHFMNTISYHTVNNLAECKGFWQWLTMVYNTQESLGLWTLPIVRKLQNTTFQKLDLVSSSGEWRETTSLLGPLERANLNHRHVCGIMSLVRSYKNCGCTSWEINLRRVLCLEGTYSA